MKKTFVFILSALLSLSISAQNSMTWYKSGDLDGDLKLTVNDAKLAIKDYVNNTAHYAYPKTNTLPYVPHNREVAGTWWKDKDHKFQLNADGTTDYGTRFTYQYMPALQKIVFFNANGEVEDLLDVVSAPSDFMTTCSRGSDQLVTYGHNDPYAGRDYVDLGLSVYWATCNVGASSPEEYGHYFAWGETEPKAMYDSSNLFDKTFEIYNNDGGKTKLQPEHDAASANWNGMWRMPAMDELQELIDGCYWQWVTTYNGKSVKGYIVYKAKDEADKGKKSFDNPKLVGTYTLADAHIFLPAAGGFYGDETYFSGTAGNYWSSTIRSVSNSEAKLLNFFNKGVSDGSNYRNGGHPVRAVCSINAHGSTPITLEMDPTFDVDNSCIAGTTWVEVKGTDKITFNEDGTIEGTSWTYQWMPNACQVLFYSSNGALIAVYDIIKHTDTSLIFSKKGSNTLIVYADNTPDPYNGHDYVDLGTGVKWATMNIGADSPEDYGDYFAWGETIGAKSGKKSFGWSNYKWCNGSKDSLTKYCTNSSYGTVDSKTVLDPEDDAAHVNWGGSWRMPTSEEQYALVPQCYWQWVTSYNGKSVNGYIVYKAKAEADKGKISHDNPSLVGSYSVSDPHIFLPAAGYRLYLELVNADSYGYYWSSSLVPDSSDLAYNLGFYSDYWYWYSYGRERGRSVRAVCP